MEMLEKAKSYW